METYRVFLPEEREHLIAWDFAGKETIKQSILGLSESGNEIELIVNETYCPKDEEYINRSSGSVSLGSETNFNLYEKAYRTGRRAVGIAHTHPDKAYVSDKDLQDAENHLKVLRDFNIDVYMQIVIGSDGLVAFVYRLVGGQWRKADIEYIKVYRRKGIDIVVPNNSQFHPDFSISEEIQDRTLQIGGGIENALQMIRFLKWGIVGVGGVGNAFVHILKHLGMEHAVLADPDVLELSNANRFLGYKPGDEGKPKVDIASRELHAFNPEMKLELLQESFPSENTKQALKRCDVLIVVPDDDYVRLQVSEFASLYAKPLFSGGAAIYADEDGKPSRICCSIMFQHVPPLGPCLKCLGMGANHPRHVMEQVDEARRSYVKGPRGPIRTPASVISLHLQCANLIVRNILYYLSDISDEPVPLYALFDEIPLVVSDISSMFTRREECAICGSHGFWGYGDYAPMIRIPGKQELEAELKDGSY